VLGFLLPERAFGSMPAALAKVARTALLTVPTFFSGLAFSGELAAFVSVDIALASNMLGSMAGGLIEYNSMYFGFRALYLFALGFYVLAFAAVLVRRLAKRAAVHAQQAEAAQRPQEASS
jgi:ABC-type polysaccharide transport system permease subunit